jgi:hypothetical protein
MGADARWVDDVIAGWADDTVPEFCQQFGCRQPVETWCSLCRAFFCHEHDELYPRRRHDCLRGKAETEE